MKTEDKFHKYLCLKLEKAIQKSDSIWINNRSKIGCFITK